MLWSVVWIWLNQLEDGMILVAYCVGVVRFDVGVMWVR